MAKGISTAKLADLFGITTRRVRQLEKEGMPKIDRDKWNVKDCVRWYTEFLRSKHPPNEIAHERLRVERAKAEKLELENAILRGENKSMSEYLVVTSAIWITLRNEIVSNMPGRISKEVFKEASNPGEVKKIIKREGIRALNNSADSLIDAKYLRENFQITEGEGTDGSNDVGQPEHSSSS